MGTSSEQTCKYSFASQSPNCLFRDFSVICCFYLAFTEQKQRKDLRRKKKDEWRQTLDVFFIVWCGFMCFVCSATACLTCLVIGDCHNIPISGPLSLIVCTQPIRAKLGKSCLQFLTVALSWTNASSHPREILQFMRKCNNWKEVNQFLNY